MFYPFKKSVKSLALYNGNLKALSEGMVHCDRHTHALPPLLVLDAIVCT